ncbi:hypothetical protein [Streptomyces albipurpureus]|uniref:Lipoprotein n=1 Tax=Streptomyces albipurpureus TaxID=2897419 RepID=A0ABT0UFU5_9ACTN|nr:hypothetical protein [Streptomyces sp. CWNU-1]MCM2386874.1 hypothetical protein [Streptomyces sp. CWNU-1]
MVTRKARWSALAVTATAVLGCLAAPAALAAPTTAAPARAALAVPPQQNIPELQAGGVARRVTIPPDRQVRRGPGYVDIEAPPYTRIIALNTNCDAPGCTTRVAPDGLSASGYFPGNRVTFLRPMTVDIAADYDAPYEGGYFSGSFTLLGETQPLTVRILPEPEDY